MEMKCIFNIGKNISILAKVTQVSDVAHGPLVLSHTYSDIIHCIDFSYNTVFLSRA
jgi:hypothetical protein